MTGLWFSGTTGDDNSDSSALVGRNCDPGREPEAAAPALLTLIAEPLFAGDSIVEGDDDGPGFWIGVLVCVDT